MKVLRIEPSWPTEEKPGSGLPAYCHTLFSKDENYLITQKRPGILCPQNLIIYEVPYSMKNLGRIDGNKIVKALKLIRKVFIEVVFFFRSKKYIDEIKPDVIHIYSSIPIINGLYARKKYHARFIMSALGTDVERIISSKLYSKLLSLPDTVAVVSEAMIEKLKGIKTKKPIAYIGNGVDENVFFNKKTVRDKTIIQVASLRWQKGQVYLLEAFKRLHVDFPEYKLKLIGDGDQRTTLEEYCKENGIGESVVFLGYMKQEEIAEELNRSELFVLSSVLEGFPKVIIESMACGTPVISTDVGNARAIISDSGLIVNSKDSMDLYNAMYSFFSQRLFTKFSALAEEYSKQYSWEKVAERLHRIYEGHDL